MQDMLTRLLTEDITLVVATAPGDGCVLADRGHIEQVVLNLVVNARDAMPAGGVLTVETQNVELDEQSAAQLSSALPGSYVVLAVSDTGVGMDARTQARLFEPYFTTKPAGAGTGLGLATVHGIVTQSCGSIGVHSELGKGSTFRVYLPRVDGCQPVPQPGPAPASDSGTETILVVEDETLLRDLARRMLEAVGYVVLTAESGEEALRVLEAYDGPVDLVLTDVVMPGISGHGLTEQLAARGSTIRILYSSGYTDDVILGHGLLDTTIHFLSKPYTMADLTRKVRETLDAPPPGAGKPVR
jgi:CheY-like chemotaxis protein